MPIHNVILDAHQITASFSSLMTMMESFNVATLVDFSSSPVVTLGILVAGLYFIFEVHWLLVGSKRKSTTTLNLRVLDEKEENGHLAGRTYDNIFCQEQTALFDALFPHFDHCVMKHTATELPVLSEQERMHAKMHFECRMERRESDDDEHRHSTAIVPLRWKWLVEIEKFVLRDAPNQIQLGLCGHIEATTPTWAYLMFAMPFTNGYLPNGMIYHLLEEMEHSTLTTQWLRNKVYTLTPLLTFPLAFIFYFFLHVAPPLMRILIEPTCLLKPKTYRDLVLYYCSFIPLFLLTCTSSVLFWILPFIVVSDSERDTKRQAMEAEAKRRGMRYDVIKQVTYVIQGSEISILGSS